MTQSIIVYRSPVEAMFWETFMNSPYTWPIIVSIFTFLVTIWIVTSIGDRFIRRGSYRRITPWGINLVPSWEYRGYVSLVVAAMVAVAVFYHMI